MLSVRSESKDLLLSFRRKVGIHKPLCRASGVCPTAGGYPLPAQVAQVDRVRVFVGRECGRPVRRPDHSSATTMLFCGLPGW